MKFAYADPPYFGSAKRFYGKMHPDAAVYDTVKGHRDLIKRLSDDFPDGWALSCGSVSLKTILPLCPRKARIAAWVKTFYSFKPGQSVGYAWEPVIWMGGRKRAALRPMLRDWVAVGMTTGRHFKGAKPEEFCYWIFELLGMQAEDEFVDLFPGSGSVARAWESWKRIRWLFC